MRMLCTESDKYSFWHWCGPYFGGGGFIFVLKMHEKITFFIFLWFLGTANILKIYMLKNRFKITNLATRKKIHKNSNRFQNSKQNNRFLDGFWTANLEIDGFCIQIGSDIFKIFDFSSTSVDPKIYLYLVDSKKFGCFEKLWVWIVHFCSLSPVAQDYDTPWHPSFVRILRKFQIPTCTALQLVTNGEASSSEMWPSSIHAGHLYPLHG